MYGLSLIVAAKSPTFLLKKLATFYIYVCRQLYLSS